MTNRIAVKFAQVAFVAVTLCAATSCVIPSAPAQDAGGSTSDIKSRDAADVRNGGTLRIEVTKLPERFNSLLAGTDPEYWPIAQATHPTAFVIRSDGIPQLNHDFFTNVELTSVNPQVVTYTINREAVWTDGTPITWQDIKSQFDAFSGADRDLHGAAPSRFDRVASVTRGDDDRQAVVTFKMRSIDWRSMFSGRDILLPRSVTAAPQALNAVAADAPSAGPFMIDSADDKEVTLVRNPKWWGRPPHLDSIVFVRIDVNDRVKALRDGRIDVTRLTSDYGVVEADLLKDVEVRDARERRWQVINFNGESPALLADKKLREAIVQGIDRDGILSIVQRGMVDYPVPLANHLYVVGQQGHRNNAVECNCLAARYDPDTARKQLDDLDWRLVGDIRQKGGIPLSLKFEYPNTVENNDLARLLRDDLAEIGVELRTCADKCAPEPGQIELTLFELTDDGFPLKTISERYGSAGRLNFGRIGNPEIDQMIAQTLEATQEVSAQKRANEVDVMLWQEVHSLPLGQSQGYVAVPANLANYGAFGAASIDFTAIGYTQEDE